MYPYSRTVSTTSVIVVPKRVLRPDFSYDAYDPDRVPAGVNQYVIGDYVCHNGRAYMCVSTPGGVEPTHTTGIVSGWMFIPSEYRLGFDLCNAGLQNAYIAYDHDAEAGEGLALFANGSTISIDNFQGEVRAITESGSTNLGVSER